MALREAHLFVEPSPGAISIAHLFTGKPPPAGNNLGAVPAVESPEGVDDDGFLSEEEGFYPWATVYVPKNQEVKRRGKNVYKCDTVESCNYMARLMTP
jgi:hypothetical protein